MALLVAFIAAAVIVTSLDHPSSTPTVPAAKSTSTVASGDLTRLRTATDTADGATASAVLKLHALTSLPTPVTVAGVINPYVASLQQYKKVLAETAVPAAIRTAAVRAHVLVTRDVQFLGTVNGLPSLRLGSYLIEFGRDAAQLQTTLANLQQRLQTSQT